MFSQRKPLTTPSHRVFIPPPRRVSPPHIFLGVMGHPFVRLLLGLLTFHAQQESDPEKYE